MPASRLLLLFFVFLTTSFARTIDLGADVFGSGVVFDQIQAFIETSGMQFDASAPVTFAAESSFAGWDFALNTPTYVVGKGPETTGNRLTLVLSDSTPNASSVTVTYRVYLLHSGKIVGSYDVTIGPSGTTITAQSSDLAALQALQQQAFTIAGITPPGVEAGGDGSDGSGGASGGSGGSGSGGGANLQAGLDVPEPGTTALIAATLLLLSGLRRLRPSLAPVA